MTMQTVTSASASRALPDPRLALPKSAGSGPGVAFERSVLPVRQSLHAADFNLPRAGICLRVNVEMAVPVAVARACSRFSVVFGPSHEL